MTGDGTTTTYEYEYWDCPSCARKRIRGDVEGCPGCGKPRGEGVLFYAVDGAETVTGEAELRAAEAGPDWECTSCRSYNSADLTSCRGCGNPREADDRGYFEVREAAGRRSAGGAARTPPPVPLRGAAGNDLDDADDGGAAGVGARGAFDGMGGPLAALAFLFIFGLAARFSSSPYGPESADYVVRAKRWEREVRVERLAERELDDWEGDMRGELVRRISASEEVHHNERFVASMKRETWTERERFQSGTKTETYSDSERYRSGSRQECSTSRTSLGNGRSRTDRTCRSVPTYSTRSVTKRRTVPEYSYRSVARSREVPVYGERPVMATKVRYVARVWEPLPVPRAEGEGGEPSWPAVVIGTGAGGTPDRETGRAGRYRLALSLEDRARLDDGFPEEVVIEIPEAEWGRFPVGDTVEMELVGGTLRRRGEGQDAGGN